MARITDLTGTATAVPPEPVFDKISSGEDATLFEMNAPPTSFIEGLEPLEGVNKAASAEFRKRAGTCERSSYLPARHIRYGFCHGWVPDPGDYRRSLWKGAGYPQGPESYDDLFNGGRKIFEGTGIPVTLGMSQEIDPEFYARALTWSFGSSIQNEDGNVTFDSEQVIEAVQYQKQFFRKAMTPAICRTGNPTYTRSRPLITAFLRDSAALREDPLLRRRLHPATGTEPRVDVLRPSPLTGPSFWRTVRQLRDHYLERSPWPLKNVIFSH